MKGILEARSEKYHAAKINGMWYNAKKIYPYLPKENNVEVEFSTSGKDLIYVEEIKNKKENNDKLEKEKIEFKSYKSNIEYELNYFFKIYTEIELTKAAIKLIQMKQDKMKDLDIDEIIMIVKEVKNKISKTI